MALQPSQMNEAEFLARFADVFEHSPWIAQATWARGLNAGHDKATGLHDEFSEVIRNADHEQQMTLLLSHPELGLGLGKEQELTEASKFEQTGAGLNNCSVEEFAEFQKLNACYRAKFGFPFIMAVKGYDRQQILQAFRMRLINSKKQEFCTAVDQVIRIGLLRIEDKFK